MDHGPQTMDHRAWTTDHGPRTTDHGPRTMALRKCSSGVCLATGCGPNPGVALEQSALRLHQPTAWLQQSQVEYATGLGKAGVSQKHEPRFLSAFLFLRNMEANTEQKSGQQKAETRRGRRTEIRGR